MVQIYVRGKTPTIDDFISCLRTRLSENLEMRDASLDISADDPCIVVCQRLTRYSSDISTGTRDLSEPLNNKAIIVLHVTEEHALPNFLPADNIKREFPGFGLIVDIACLDGDIYSCDMNTEGLRKLQIFLKEQRSCCRPHCCRPQRWRKGYIFKVLLLFIVAFSIFGIAQIVIGAIYIDDCSIEKMIPGYLIVNGLLCFGFYFYPLFSWPGMGEDDNKKVTKWCSCVGEWIFYFIFVSWNMCGAVWFRQASDKVNKDTYVPETEGTCNDTLLKFSRGSFMIGVSFPFVFIVMKMLKSIMV